MPIRSGRAFYWIVAGLLLGASLLPYIYAASASGEDMLFGGFLFNPIDGNSYLAKMQQGLHGSCTFTLPFTAEKGDGSLLNLYYIFLGHLARWSGLSLLWVYHLARLGGSLVLLAGLFRFVQRTLGEGVPARLAYLVAALGSGMGWLALPWGAFTTDFWVAEAYPFLSAYAAPHFSLGLGLLLVLLAPPAAPAQEEAWPSRALRTLLLSCCLAIISPFGVVIVLVGLAWPFLKAFFPLRWESFTAALGERLPWVLLGGGPWLLYYQWAAWRDPLLASWNAQNLTPTPPLWDLILAFSPFLLLAVPGVVQAVRKDSANMRWVAAWLLLGMVLLYLPIGLQRRFMMGLYVPMVVLAVWLLNRMLHSYRRLWLVGLLLFVLSLPTNLVVLLTARHAVVTQDAQIYYSQAEADAFRWIASQTPPDSLILASPDTGLLLPAHTGRRVIYGHPFETVQAETQQAAVEAYFAAPRTEFLAEHQVDYVFYGPRERLLGGPMPQGLALVYESQGVSLYAAP
jgi:hypothetical protein